jgi:hypothetical protein
MKLGHALVLVMIASMATACGAAPARTPPAAPHGQYPYAESKAADTEPGYGAAQAPAPAGEASPELPSSRERSYAQPPAPLAPQHGALPKRERDLIDDFVVAEAAMLNAGSDCAAACRALRSMQRSAARLCSIASSDDERDRCRAAQDRVRAARERIRSACGHCSGGPSLDPSAPVDEP